MVSERKASWELIQKARDLWPPKLETIIEFLTNAERISSKNNHIIYSDKATLFHGLEKFDEAIKYWELYMEYQDEKFHQQTKINIKKAQQHQKIDYVYPWEDQLNYFNLKKFNNNSNIFIFDSEYIKNILKITRINLSKILKTFEITQEEFIEELSSGDIDSTTRLEFTWVQRIWNHRRVEFKQNGIQYSRFTSKNLIKNFPKISLILDCIFTDLLALLFDEYKELMNKINEELIKIEKLFNETGKNEQERKNILQLKYRFIKYFSNIKSLTEVNVTDIFQLKLRWEHPCEIIIDLNPVYSATLNYKWFILLDKEFNVITTTDQGYEKLKTNLKNGFRENIENFLECMDDKYKFKDTNEFLKFLKGNKFTPIKKNSAV
jgi:hypothetical protein